MNVYKEGPGENHFFRGVVPIRTLLAELESRDEEVDQEVLDYIKRAYYNLRDYQNRPKKYDTPPTPMLKNVTDESSDT